MHAVPGQRLAAVPHAALVNADGSPRVTRPEGYPFFARRVAPLLEEWGADPRLRVNPALVAAVLAKESGFEADALSGVPAYGYAQLTPAADADLLTITGEVEGWRWAGAEVASWPRSTAARRAGITRDQVRALLASGAVSARQEYFFDPVAASRAATLWLRMLEQAWTEDEWPGAHGTFARTRLNGGRPLTEGQLLDLVVVSYNQGYPYVHGLVERWGRDWTRHTNPEAMDYLERVRAYTALFQGGG